MTLKFCQNNHHYAWLVERMLAAGATDTVQLPVWQCACNNFISWTAAVRRCHDCHMQQPIDPLKDALFVARWKAEYECLPLALNES